MSLLEDLVRQAGDGQPQFAVIAGEAGIGKTRLMDHVADRHAESGARVLRTTCVELGAEGLPLAPVTAALRQLIGDLGVAGVCELLPNADPLLRLLPELGAADAGHDSQGRLFELFGVLLQRLGTDRPLMLLVDDLQWADRSTRELLGMLARTLRTGRVVVITAYRSDAVDRRHPLRPFLADLERLPRVHRVVLPRLSRAETTELIAVALAAPPDGHLVDRVYERSDGNPLYAEELARAVDTSAVPETLRDLLSRQIEALPAPAARLVRLAAVGGQRTPHDLLVAASGATETDVLRALQAATDAQVLLADGEWYAFRHGMIREVALDGVLPGERHRLHRRYAEALETDPRLVPPDRLAAELAHHWYGARDPAKALPALLHAAEAAERINAHAEQALTLARALEVWPRVPEEALPSDLDRGALWERTVVAATWAGEHLQAIDLVDRALAELDPTNDPERVATLLGLRGMSLHNLGRDGAVTSLREARDVLPASPSAARARVLDLLSAVLVLTGDPQEARTVSAEAMRTAASVSDEDTEANAQITLGVAMFLLGEHDEGIGLIDGARARALSRSDAIRHTRACVNLADVCLQRGEFDAATVCAREGLHSVAAAGVARTLGALLRLSIARALTALGRWSEADAECTVALDVDPPGRFASQVYVLRGDLALARGDLAGARRHLSLAQTTLDGGSWAVPEAAAAVRLDAEIALREGRPAVAAALVAGTLPTIAAAGATAAPYAWTLVVLGAAISTAAQRSHAADDTISGLTDELKATAAYLPSTTPLWQAYARQFAAETGHAPWAEVVAAWDDLDAAYAAARARVRAAESALAAGDRACAQRWLNGAADVAASLGAATLLEEVTLLAASARVTIGGAPAEVVGPGRARDLGLTNREIDVLRLVSAGRSNRQIGEQLFISAKTVSVHVTNILAKLGVGSRGEAAATAHRLRLFDDG